MKKKSILKERALELAGGKTLRACHARQQRTLYQWKEVTIMKKKAKKKSKKTAKKKKGGKKKKKR